MRVSLVFGLAAVALVLAVSGSASAYSIFERNDSNDFDDDPANDTGDVSGFCANNTGFTANYQRDEAGVYYYWIDQITGASEDAVISSYCQNHGG